MNTYKVLIVEDTEDIARLVSMALHQIGLETHHCNNGFKALEFLESEPDQPDLIVLDIGMPGMSGWELLEIIRQRERWREIPVVVATAFTDPANRVIGMMNDVDSYITKPYGPVEIKEVVGGLLNLQR